MNLCFSSGTILGINHSIVIKLQIFMQGALLMDRTGRKPVCRDVLYP
ncbi:MAG: hypothetical protein MjAS7_2757 [Metallosphaera javensis (ex Sakai et al. 2022)]|nr:MAG: hypothetical protein MjAS7_2757 [Metallosphaera javensis (ex Sakai et al. 2022)]